ncbi:MAG: YdcF family protein [Acidimicrobiales bacterium]
MNRRRVGAVVGAAAVMVSAAYGWWVGHPPVPADPTGDAVVSHAGGRGERLDGALDLMELGAAPTLVLLLGSSRSERAAALCGRDEPYEVVCIDPDPATTEGEARTVADLARERAWRSLVVVTSDYHLRRAVLVDRRCSGLVVTGVPVEPTARGRLDRLELVAKEMVALPVAFLSSC